MYNFKDYKSFNDYKNKVISMPKINYLLTILFLLIMIVDRDNSIVKTIITTFMLFGGLILLEILMFEFEEKLIFILAFTLPFNVAMFISTPQEIINLAGAKNFFTFSFYDLLIIFTLIYEINKYGIKSRFKDNSKYLILPAVYLLINVISIFIAFNQMVAFYEVLRIVKGLMLFMIFGFYFTKEMYVLFVRAIGLSICGQLIIGILQILAGRALGLQFLGESHSVFRNAVEGLEKGMSGTMAHPGTLALYSIFVLSILIFVNRELLKEKYVYIVATILTTILTFSRTSMILMIIVLICAAMIYILRNNIKKLMNGLNKVKSIRFDKRTLSILAMILFLIVGVGLLFRPQITAVVDRFVNSDAELQMNSRLWHTRIGLNAYSERESFGYGANNYTYVIRDMHPEEYEAGRFHYVQPVHNIYVLYLVEIGILGVLVYCLLYGKLIIDTLKGLNVKDTILRTILISIGVWAIAIMIYNLTGWSAAKDYFINIMWIVLGLNVFAIRSLKEEKDTMRILLTGYYGAGNFGDDIMLEVICKKLLKENKNVKITVLKMFERKIEVDLPKEVKVIDFSKVFGRLRKITMKLIFRMNDFFLWGGGTCFTDEDGDGLYVYMKMAKEQGLKIGYLGVGVGKLTKQERIDKTKYLMNNLDFISLRDEKSYEYCKKHVPNWKEKVFLGEDLAYLYFENIDLSKNIDANKKDKTILVSWRNLVNYRTEKEEILLIDKLVEFIKYLLKEDEYKVLVLPLDDRKDIPRCEYIYEELSKEFNDKVKIIKNITPAEKVDLLMECDLNISGRLHGIFVSELVGIKTIGLSYSVKIVEFLKSINKECDYIDVDNINKDILIEKFNSYEGNIDKDLIQNHIKKSNNNIVTLSKTIDTWIYK